MANEMFTFTEEEMIDIYDYIESAAIVTTFDVLHYISEIAEAEEAPGKIEALEKDFREKLDRVQSSVSKKASETVPRISLASALRSYNESNESKESED